MKKKTPATSNSKSGSSRSRLGRRHFIQAAGAASVAMAGTTAVSASSYNRISGANDRLGVGQIGVGGMGTAHSGAIVALKESNNLLPVATADCWVTRAEKAAKTIGAANHYQDHRKVLDHKDVDYVTIASPEHWHCKMTLDALAAGKHVYCEKPMTHTLAQGLEVVDAQKASGLKMQVGVQSMSDDSYISARKAIDEGMIGQVVQAQIEYVRRYNQGPWRDPNLDEKMPKPNDLDWKAWLGDAPNEAWNPHHYFEWRNYARYSGGIATDLFIHRITRIMKACNLMFPSRVVGMGGIWQWDDGRDLPDNFEMICEYPRGMTVYVLGTMSNRVGIDHLIRGYRGTLQFTDTGWTARDKDGKVLGEHKKTGAEDIVPHHSNLHAAIRDGAELNCPVDLGMAGVAAVTMANQSWRDNTMMAWDAEHRKAVPAHTIPNDHRPQLRKAGTP